MVELSLKYLDSIPVKRLREDAQIKMLYEKLKEVFEAEALG